MKKTYLKLSFALVAFAFCFSSCKFFTTSWGTGAVRNSKEQFSKLESTELADMITDPAVMNDSKASSALLETLGSKDLSTLSDSQKKNVMDLVTNNSVSLDSISTIVNAATASDVQPKELVKEILDNVNTVDTKAVTKILSDPKTLETSDPKSIGLSAICLVAQVVKVEENNNENLVDSVMEEVSKFSNVTPENLEETINTAATNILGDSESAEASIESLKVALKAVYAIKDSPAEILPGMSIDSLFNKIKGSN